MDTRTGLYWISFDEGENLSTIVNFSILMSVRQIVVLTGHYVYVVGEMVMRVVWDGNKVTERTSLRVTSGLS